MPYRITKQAEMKPKWTLGMVMSVEAAERVIVHVQQGGDDPRSPFVEVYDVARGGHGELGGTVGFTNARRPVRRTPLTLAARVARKMLATLADAEVRRGAYKPLIEHTDDFPQIEIAVHVGPDADAPGIALLFTTSQGELHSPWGACIRGERFTLPGDEVGTALMMIRRAVARPEEHDEAEDA